MSGPGRTTITIAPTRRCHSAKRRHRAARHSASSIHISRARKGPRAIGGIAASTRRIVGSASATVLLATSPTGTPALRGRRSFGPIVPAPGEATHPVASPANHEPESVAFYFVVLRAGRRPDLLCRPARFDTPGGAPGGFTRYWHDDQKIGGDPTDTMRRSKELPFVPGPIRL
jgi:hypothetical protein